MKTQELLDFTRFQLRDIKKKYLWTDEEIVGHLSEAQEKAARNARLIRDFTTPEVCRISVNTSRQWYVLDPRIIYVRRVTLATRSLPLQKISYRDLDGQQPGWIDRTGTPDRWCGDFETQKLWFNRKPTAADTAKLYVVRMPLEALSLTKLSASPEIHPTYHRSLHHWALYRCYSKNDADTEATDLAADAYNAFTAEFGEDSSAIEEEWARQHYGDQDMEGEL